MNLNTNQKSDIPALTFWMSSHKSTGLYNIQRFPIRVINTNYKKTTLQKGL